MFDSAKFVVNFSVFLWSAATHVLNGPIWDNVSSDAFGHTADASLDEVVDQVPFEFGDFFFAIFAPWLGSLADVHSVRFALMISLASVVFRNPILIKASETLGAVHVVQAAQMATAKHTSKNLRAAGFCSIALFYGAGLVMGLLLQEVLVPHCGLRAIYQSALVLLALNIGLVATRFPQDAPDHHSAIPQGAVVFVMRVFDVLLQIWPWCLFRIIGLFPVIVLQKTVLVPPVDPFKAVLGLRSGIDLPVYDMCSLLAIGFVLPYFMTGQDNEIKTVFAALVASAAASLAVAGLGDATTLRVVVAFVSACGAATNVGCTVRLTMIVPRYSICTALGWNLFCGTALQYVAGRSSMLLLGTDEERVAGAGVAFLALAALLLQGTPFLLVPRSRGAAGWTSMFAASAEADSIFKK
jgi:hypothetical protein